MAVASYSESYLTGVPYLTTAEYQTAPTAVDYDDLLPGGTTQAQVGVLANVIARASSFVDDYCFGAGGVLAASVDTEAGEVTADRDGNIRVATRFAPLQELKAFSCGQPGSLSPVDVTSANAAVWVERNGFVISSPTLATSSVGPLQFGSAGWPGQRQFATWTYVSGFANTVLASNAAQGATTITVVDPTGFYAGRTTFKIYDGGAADEGTTLLTQQLSCVSVAGNVITLSAPLTNAHAAGVAVSAFPQSIKQAVILLTSWLIKTRGSDSLVMETMQNTHVPGEAGSFDDYEAAIDLLEPWRVIV